MHRPKGTTNKADQTSGVVPGSVTSDDLEKIGNNLRNQRPEAGVDEIKQAAKSDLQQVKGLFQTQSLAIGKLRQDVDRNSSAIMRIEAKHNSFTRDIYGLKREMQMMRDGLSEMFGALQKVKNKKAPVSGRDDDDDGGLGRRPRPRSPTKGLGKWIVPLATIINERRNAVNAQKLFEQNEERKKRGWEPTEEYKNLFRPKILQYYDNLTGGAKAGYRAIKPYLPDAPDWAKRLSDGKMPWHGDEKYDLPRGPDGKVDLHALTKIPKGGAPNRYTLPRGPDGKVDLKALTSPKNIRHGGILPPAMSRMPGMPDPHAAALRRGQPFSFEDNYYRSKIEDQKSDFMRYGKLPPGFEMLDGHMGTLGSARAVAAGGAMPLGGRYAGGRFPSPGASYTPGTPSYSPPGPGAVPGPGPGGATPSVPGPAGSVPGVTPSPGTPPSGPITGGLNPRLAAARERFFTELDNNPSLRRDVIKTIAMENGRSPEAMADVLESMVNRADMRGYKSLQKQIHDGFYGPVNRGGLSGPLSKQHDEWGATAIDLVRRGRNNIEYRTDQGMLTDPGARRYMQMPDKSGWIKRNGENYFLMDKAGRNWHKKQLGLDEEYTKNEGLKSPVGKLSGGPFGDMFDQGTINFRGGAAPVIHNHEPDQLNALNEDFKNYNPDGGRWPGMMKAGGPVELPALRVTPNEGKKFLVLPGWGGTYGNSPQDKEAFREMARKQGGTAVFLDGDSRHGQVGKAIQELSKGGYAGVFGHSGGGINIPHIFNDERFKALPPEIRNGITKSVAVGSPELRGRDYTHLQQYGFEHHGNFGGRHSDAPRTYAQRMEDKTVGLKPPSAVQPLGKEGLVLPPGADFAGDLVTGHRGPAADEFNPRNLDPAKMRGRKQYIENNISTIEGGVETLRSRHGTGSRSDPNFPGATPGAHLLAPHMYKGEHTFSLNDINGVLKGTKIRDPKVVPWRGHQFRDGMLIHPVNGKVPRGTLGCLGIPRPEWDAFQAKVQAMMKNNPGGVVAVVDYNGKTDIMSKADFEKMYPEKRLVTEKEFLSNFRSQQPVEWNNLVKDEWAKSFPGQPMSGPAFDDFKKDLGAGLVEKLQNQQLPGMLMDNSQPPPGTPGAEPNKPAGWLDKLWGGFEGLAANTTPSTPPGLFNPDPLAPGVPSPGTPPSGMPTPGQPLASTPSWVDKDFNAGPNVGLPVPAPMAPPAVPTPALPPDPVKNIAPPGMDLAPGFKVPEPAPTPAAPSPGAGPTPGASPGGPAGPGGPPAGGDQETEGPSPGSGGSGAAGRCFV